MAVMNAIPGVVCPRPQGAFYVFPDISCAFGKAHQPSGRTIGNDLDFCTALLDEKNVACIPGSAFGRAAFDAHQLHLSDAATAAGAGPGPGVLLRYQ
jgi:aspartate/methionine/tyrosine aminotransferase